MGADDLAEKQGLDYSKAIRLNTIIFLLALTYLILSIIACLIFFYEAPSKLYTQ